MRGCELLWDVETADRLQEMVEQATGRPCPCMEGLKCPIVSDPASLLQRQIEAAA